MKNSDEIDLKTATAAVVASLKALKVCLRCAGSCAGGTGEEDADRRFLEGGLDDDVGGGRREEEGGDLRSSLVSCIVSGMAKEPRAFGESGGGARREGSLSAPPSPASSANRPLALALLASARRFLY